MLPMEISCQDVKLLQAQGDDFFLLDCREADEYQLVHIKSARLVPMSEITERAAELADHRTRRVVVYCHHGGRSLRVAGWLRQQGFTQAQSMAGGIDAWATQIEPGMPRY